MKHFLPSSFVALALGALMTTAFAARTVPDRAEDVQPLVAGDQAPSFVAKTVDGADYAFTSGELESPTLLIFYRGGWCPFCNTHLKELQDVVPQLNDAGHDVLFLSADGPHALVDSLKEPMPGYRLLSDASMDAARQFGISFRVDDATFTKYQGYGIDLESASGFDHHELPVPSVFLINTDGEIAFAYSNPDYKIRLSPAELLAAAGL